MERAGARRSGKAVLIGRASVVVLTVMVAFAATMSAARSNAGKYGATLYCWLTPSLRELPRSVRPLILIPLLLVPFALGLVAMRRKGLNLRQAGLVGAVMLIEDLPLDAAVRRSAELLEGSGGLRNTLQKWYLLAVAFVSMLIGALLGARVFAGGAVEMLLVYSPFIVGALAVGLTVNSVFGSLLYLSSRRATGESLEQIFADFETSALPQEQRAAMRDDITATLLKL